MSNWWNKEELTSLGADLKKAHETVVSDVKTKVKNKVKNIVGGIKATPAMIKRTFGKK